MLCACALLAGQASAGVIFVDPFDDMQSIIDAPTTLDGDVLLIFPGVYDQRIDLKGKALTLRSIDGPASTIFDGTTLNGSIVHLQSGETRDAVIEGLTFRNGSATNGGAILLADGSPTIIDCVFTSNTATAGGAISLFTQSSPLLVDCAFVMNNATSGGAIALTQQSELECRTSTFIANEAVKGGAISARVDTIVGINSCTFDQNDASNAGGAVYADDRAQLRLRSSAFTMNDAQQEGGAVFIGDDARATIGNMTFTRNHATEGGGIYVETGQLTVVNGVFSRNSASTLGGGIHAIFAAECTIDSSTFGGNSAGVSGGGIFDTGSDTHVQNSVLFGNLVGNTSGPGAQISSLSSVPIVNFTCIQGGWLGAGGIGIIDVDPQFIAPQEDDLQLATTSPCIDVGDEQSLPADVLDLDGDDDVEETLPVDAGGAARILGTTVDLGAYETFTLAPTSCLGDCSPMNPDGSVGNGLVNIDDVLVSLNGFGSCPAEPAPCPCDIAPIQNGDVGNGIVNIDDLLALLNNFGVCPAPAAESITPRQPAHD